MSDLPENTPPHTHEGSSYVTSVNPVTMAEHVHFSFRFIVGGENSCPKVNISPLIDQVMFMTRTATLRACPERLNGENLFMVLVRWQLIPPNCCREPVECWFCDKI